MDTQTDMTRGGSGAKALYEKLEDRCIMRDQKGASDVYYDLVRAGRSLHEIVAEGVRIHAPFTHVPYHERMDDGYPNFVNNDHCLLSARATINLSRMLPPHLEPLRDSAPLPERLNNWMTLVHRGQVIDAYRTFLGLMEDTSNRKEVLAEMCFAGLIDVQDRVLHNRSYTTGHKAYRARSTVELGNAIGWDKAHNVIYAGALDIAVGPRWYSTYEVACNYVKMMIEGETLH